MLIGEPAPTQADLHFSIFGIPVRVHPWFWIVSIILGLRAGDPLLIIIWVGCVFVSILIHEFGHALAALAHGWKPWITLYSFGGLASYRPTREDPRSKILISLAGPGAGFVFIAFVISAVHASGHTVSLERSVDLVTFEPFANYKVNVVLYFLIYINIYWGLINLLPVYPLDGGQIAREVLSVGSGDGIRKSLQLSIATAAAIAIASVLLWERWYLGFMFGYLAYLNYATYQAFTGGGGFGGPRRW